MTKKYFDRFGHEIKPNTGLFYDFEKEHILNYVLVYEKDDDLGAYDEFGHFVSLSTTDLAYAKIDPDTYKEVN